MTISTLHRLDKITGPLALTQISQMKWDAGIKSMIEYPAGHTDPMFRANQEQKPLIEFTCADLATLLGTVTLAGLAISGTPLVTYFKKATTTGNVARATLSHRKITVNLGFLHWTRLSLPHNGRGEASCILTAVYDGTNDPFVYAGSQALSGNLTATEYFGAGPVSINGVSVPGIKSIDVDSGTELFAESSDGEVWDTFIGLQKRTPTVTIKTLENINWVTLGLAGLALNGSTGLVFYARKYSSTGRVANATAEHIKFIGLNGSAIPMDSDGQDSSPISDTIKVELISGSDSILPLTLNAASAIT